MPRSTRTSAGAAHSVRTYSHRTAAFVGWTMLTSGVLAASITSYIARDGRPAMVAAGLAACIVFYDGVFKRTPLAPLAMGTCRMLNVLLGMSLGPLATEVATPYVRWGTAAAWLIAGGIGIYIVGVTIFARTEAQYNSRGRLVGRHGRATGWNGLAGRCAGADRESSRGLSSARTAGTCCGSYSLS